MALYTIGDPHLSLGCDKPMDVFPGWDNYVERLTARWQEAIAPGDTVVVLGDISWGMTLEEALADLRYLDNLPGQKIFIKGNHDYWWTSQTKVNAFFSLHGLNSLRILYNNAIEAEGVSVCGTRGWIFDKDEPHNTKILAREAGRLALSLRDAPEGLERIAFIHYPPVYGNVMSEGIVDTLVEYGVRRCYYGHLHGSALRFAFNGTYRGIHFQLVSGDYVGFAPVRLL